MMKSEIGKKTTVLGGLMWSFFERISAQIVSTIVAIVLARILDPSHFGAISIVTVLISFLNVFVSAGFGSALVQKKSTDSLDYNTTFFISLFVAVILYCVLFAVSPSISQFYSMPILNNVIRVMGLRLIIASINNIQQASIRREMRFRSFFWATLIGTVFSGFFGVLMAFKGYGIWALATQYLLNAFIDTIMLFVIGTWIPRMEFSLDRAKAIWDFGWKVLATEIVYTVEGDIRSLIIGRVFGSVDLAYYDQGRRYPSLLVTNINASIEKVLLPVYSKKQDNYRILLQTLRRTIRVGSYVLAPVLIGFLVISPIFVETVLTSKWLPCVPFIRIFCISFLTRPLESSCHQALLAIGRSDIVLKCMIIINTTALLGVIIAVFGFKSVLLIAIFSLASTLISLCAFLHYTRHIIGYKLLDQITDIIPSIILSIIMGGVVFVLGGVLDKSIYALAIEILVGAGIYYALSSAVKPEAFVLIINHVKNTMKNKE